MAAAVKVGAKIKRPERKGLGRVQQAAKRADERRAAGDRKWFKLEDGESGVYRVLGVQEDFKDGYTHQIEYETEIEENGRKKTVTRRIDIMCLDQDEKGVPCPGCAEGLERRYKFWTPTIKRATVEDENGNLVISDNRADDEIVIWSGGITVARKLDKMDVKKGLRNRDIIVEREGIKKKTRYEIDWNDDDPNFDNPLGDNDKKLEANAPDLSRYTKIRDFDDFWKSPKELNEDDDDDSDIGEKSKTRGSPFGKAAISARVSAGKAGPRPVAGAAAKATAKVSAKPAVKAKASSKPKVAAKPKVGGVKPKAKATIKVKR